MLEAAASRAEAAQRDFLAHTLAMEAWTTAAATPQVTAAEPQVTAAETYEEGSALASALEMLAALQPFEQPAEPAAMPSPSLTRARAPSPIVLARRGLI